MFSCVYICVLMDMDAIYSNPIYPWDSEKSPMNIEKSPMNIEKSPMNIEKSPMNIEKSPMT